ncbi:MAG: dUTP diphosphatase [Candidatus Pacearchaeota archaeon]
MKVKFKKLSENAVIPKYSKDGDACVDLTAVECNVENGEIMVYKTGLAMEIPHGYVGLIFPRSSISKTKLRLCNSVGVIDSGYRGEIMFKFNLDKDSPFPMYNIGDRVGQLMIIPIPFIEFEEVDELSESERGVGGFGSTGK